jgi:hypothetical protein
LFGKLGRRRRRRLPDCLGINFIKHFIRDVSFIFSVKMIRDTFPEPSGVYIGYRDTGEISEED